MADAWNGSWGTSWGASWGSGVAPAAAVTAPSYGGYTPEQGDEWLRAANQLIALERKLTEAETQPAEVQAEIVAEAEQVIERAEEATGFDAPTIDADTMRGQLSAMREAANDLLRKMHESYTRERQRRTNNWLMMQ